MKYRADTGCIKSRSDKTDHPVHSHGHPVRQPCAKVIKSHNKHKCHNSYKTRNCRIFSGKYAVNGHTSFVLSALRRFYHGFFAKCFYKIKTHIGKCGFPVKSALFFHDIHKLGQNFFLTFRKIHPVFDQPVFFHDLRCCKTDRKSCFLCVRFDQMSRRMDTAVNRAYRISR